MWWHFGINRKKAGKMLVFPEPLLNFRDPLRQREKMEHLSAPPPSRGH
jgi:hypothetical protein